MPPFAPSKSASLKRKAISKFLPVKKARIQQHNIDDLPWKSVSRPSETGLDGDDGILELEEVDGVEVVYENTSSGRVVKFNVGSFPLTSSNVKNLLQVVGETSAKEDKEIHKKNAQNTDQEMDGALNFTDSTPFDCQ